MSGGSYNYLYCKDSGQILNHLEDLGDMSDRLCGLGYANDAAKETEEIICIINQFKIRIDARVGRLESVWKAIEWWDSGDSGEEDVTTALREYRGDNA